MKKSNLVKIVLIAAACRCLRAAWNVRWFIEPARRPPSGEVVVDEAPAPPPPQAEVVPVAPGPLVWFWVPGAGNGAAIGFGPAATGRRVRIRAQCGWRAAGAGMVTVAPGSPAIGAELKLAQRFAPKNFTAIGVEKHRWPDFFNAWNFCASARCRCVL